MAVERRRRGDAADQVRRAAHEVLRRAHVPPVGGVDEPVDAPALTEQLGEGLTLDRHRLALGDLLDELTAEHVAAGVDLVGRRILGLLQEVLDAPVVVGGDAAERARIGDADQVHRQVGVLLAVQGEDFPQVGPAEDVAVEHHDRRGGELGQDVADAAAGAQGFGLHDVGDVQVQGRPVAEVLLEDLGLEGGPQHDAPDAGRPDPGEQVGQEGQARGGQHRLGRRDRQGPEPGALAADQHHRLGVRDQVVVGGGTPGGRRGHGEGSCCRKGRGRGRARPAPVAGGWVSVPGCRAQPAARRADRIARRHRNSRPALSAQRIGACQACGCLSAWNRYALRWCARRVNSGTAFAA